MTTTDLIVAGIVEDELEALDAVPLEWLDDFGSTVRFHGGCPEWAED